LGVESDFSVFASTTWKCKYYEGNRTRTKGIELNYSPFHSFKGKSQEALGKESRVVQETK